MVIATRIQTTLQPTITQQNFNAALRDAFINAKWGTFLKAYSSTDNSLRFVHEIVYDSTKIYGKVVIRIRVGTDLILGAFIGTSFDGATNGSSNVSAEFVSTAFNTTKPITFDAIDGGSELKSVIVRQENTLATFTLVMPVNKPAWWDLNIYPYAFLSANNDNSLFYSSSLNPYSNINFITSLNKTTLGTANTITNKRDIELGIGFYSQSNQGIAGRTSDDLVSIAALGTNQFDSVRVAGNPTKEFLILRNIAGGFGCRVA